MLPSFLPLLVGVVLELDHFVEVVGAGLLLNVLLDEVSQLDVVHFQGVVGVEEGPSALIAGDYGVLVERPSEVDVGGDQVGLLGHFYLLDVLHSFYVLGER